MKTPWIIYLAIVVLFITIPVMYLVQEQQEYPIKQCVNIDNPWGRISIFGDIVPGDYETNQGIVMAGVGFVLLFVGFATVAMR